MAAPSGTVWGDVKTGEKSTCKGRIGIYTGVTNTATRTIVDLQVWFWSMYSVSDSNNAYYYNSNATSASSLIGSIPINHTVSTGSGWSTSNQTMLGRSQYEYDRGTSAYTKSYAARLGGIDVLAPGTMTVTTSVTIPALASYTVTYNANGGSGAPSSQTKWYGKTLTLSSTKPTRTGYTFQGWGTSASDTSVNYSAGGSYTSNSAVTLYAIWKANTLTVKYHINGGTIDSEDFYSSSGIVYNATGTVRTSTGTYNNPISSTYGLANASTFGLSRTGYTFKGWKVGSSGTTIFDQDDVTVKPTDLTSNIKTGSCTITLYAVWELKSYTVSYNANGGSGAPSNQIKYYGKALTLSSTKPTRSGYEFVGWGSSASATTLVNKPGGTYTGNAPYTYYAVWKKTITISYNANGGSGAPNNQSADIYNATTSYKFTLPTTKPTQTGYTFLGWSTSSGATSATYSAGATVTLSANLTLYAVWSINSYKLTVNPNGGSWNGTNDNSSFTQNYKTTKSIANPTWTGHTFSGWTLSGSGSLSGDTFTFGAGNGTLTAKWDTNDHTVTFNAEANGGTIEGFENKSVSFEYGTKIGTLPIAEKLNYTFLGWFTSASGGTKITSDYIITEDITLYAQFEIDTSAYINEDSVWEEGVTYVTDKNGNIKKGHAKVRVNGVWKDGFCK